MPATFGSRAMQSHVHAEPKVRNYSIKSRFGLQTFISSIHRSNTRCFGKRNRLQSRPSRLVASNPSASSESQVATPLAKSISLKYGDRSVSLIHI